MPNYSLRTEVNELLDTWSNDGSQAKHIINCLVEFLYADGWWLDKNISSYDRERFKEMAEKL